MPRVHFVPFALKPGTGPQGFELLAPSSPCIITSYAYLRSVAEEDVLIAPTVEGAPAPYRER